MPDWNSILNEVTAAGSTYDVVRRKYLAELFKVTGRNVIVYYSGWLQKPQLAAQAGASFSIDDSDKNGFMAAVHLLDRTKGLDLILHTPGGEIAATESLVDYLRSMFGKDIRAIVPQLAMSGGTMISLACKEIVMGTHSSIGPIDPQLGGLAAHAVIEEFNRARTEVQQNPALIPIWQAVLAKYPPTLVGEANKAILWSEQMVRDWLASGMFDGDADADAKIDRVMAELADHSFTLSHARHISLERAKDLDLNVVPLEDDQDLQDAVLTVHHACIQTLTATGAFKLIENQNGIAFIQTVQTMLIRQG
jgi:hypothetical protein